MSELARLHDRTVESLADPMTKLADANRGTLELAFGLQKLVLEELVFVANEMLDRTRTETHLLAEFASKLAASHSVKDWRTMCNECGQHQLDFLRRDCDRIFRHGERMIEAASRLAQARATG